MHHFQSRNLTFRCPILDTELHRCTARIWHIYFYIRSWINSSTTMPWTNSKMKDLCGLVKLFVLFASTFQVLGLQVSVTTSHGTMDWVQSLAHACYISALVQNSSSSFGSKHCWGKNWNSIGIATKLEIPSGHFSVSRHHCWGCLEPLPWPWSWAVWSSRGIA